MSDDREISENKKMRKRFKQNTIIISSDEEGFENVFQEKHIWYSSSDRGLEINSQRISQLKYIAIYVKGKKRILSIAEIKHIYEKKEGVGYEISFHKVRKLDLKHSPVQGREYCDLKNLISLNQLNSINIENGLNNIPEKKDSNLDTKNFTKTTLELIDTYEKKYKKLVEENFHPKLKTYFFWGTKNNLTRSRGFDDRKGELGELLSNLYSQFRPNEEFITKLRFINKDKDFTTYKEVDLKYNSMSRGDRRFRISNAKNIMNPFELFILIFDKDNFVYLIKLNDLEKSLNNKKSMTSDLKYRNEILTKSGA